LVYFLEVTWAKIKIKLNISSKIIKKIKIVLNDKTCILHGLQNDGSSVSDILYDGWKKRSSMTDAGQSRENDMIHERTP